MGRNMESEELRAWIKRRRLKHTEAAELLKLSVPALNKNLYRVHPIGAQTAQIVELLDQIEALEVGREQARSKKAGREEAGRKAAG